MRNWAIVATYSVASSTLSISQPVNPAMPEGFFRLAVH